MYMCWILSQSKFQLSIQATKELGFLRSQTSHIIAFIPMSFSSCSSGKKRVRLIEVLFLNLQYQEKFLAFQTRINSLNSYCKLLLELMGDMWNIVPPDYLYALSVCWKHSIHYCCTWLDFQQKKFFWRNIESAVAFFLLFSVSSWFVYAHEVHTFINSLCLLCLWQDKVGKFCWFEQRWRNYVAVRKVGENEITSGLPTCHIVISLFDIDHIICQLLCVYMKGRNDRFLWFRFFPLLCESISEIYVKRQIWAPQDIHPKDNKMWLLIFVSFVADDF